ncbi:hypothetical protein [Nitratidesulfovibrio vulgaris]|jgi:hypothetical protein|uniref:Conserved domain protein n=1 Tax=Nitratidesulfovibrio vulgaris (strain ATCC 29579 / DSM 644 / CCUG 34227 / NCIMB 8303 / VKM B-1760 / Hildenborough) TaxID=882 RepID=Q72D06_NITV2|nr:hypothetical protein [Nitratidesulfovibrio vulgaris]AAS95605.1 conserved domain protein [Nitratidesulfovibrio vulgaris str. Hildenborough]ADP86208.1 hypothetical protein Deval_1044 [Nitratidesulfovibrio vulgaris RCH1]
MNPADITQLVEALQMIAGILQQLGVPGLVSLMLAGPAAVLITVLILDHLRSRRQGELLETYRSDVADMVKEMREDSACKLESYRADMQTVLRELGDHQQETAQYYRDNVELVKAYERIATGLQDVVVNNTRTMERVLSLIENNMMCPAVREAARGKK